MLSQAINRVMRQSE